MNKRVLIISAIIIFVVILGNILSNTYLFKHLELLSYDLRSKMDTDNSFLGKNQKHADQDIVIVAIDDQALKELSESSSEKPGHQPWEKDVWNKVMNFIEKGQPKVVMFDMVFEELSSPPWYDQSFAQNLKLYRNTVLGTYLDNPIYKDTNFTKTIAIEANHNIPTATPLDVTINNKKLDRAITYTRSAPINNLYTQYNTIGVLNTVLDDDSVVRKNQPIFKLTKDGISYYMPSLAFAGFLKYMGEDGKITVKDQKICYKDRVIPIDENGIVNISWHSLGRSYIYIPISKILLNKGDKDAIKPEFFKDKMVIIGKTATGGNVDLNSIIKASYQGPEAVAVALDNFINDSNPNDVKSRKFVREIPKPIENIGITIACLIVVLLGLVPKSAFIGFLNGFVSIIAYITFTFIMFANPASRIWLPVVEPLYYLAVTAGLVFAFRFYNEMTKKASIMNVFGKFVSPKVLATVMKNPNKMLLKNTRKRITILFCDVKNFSGMCEKYPPEELVTSLNELFKEIVNIIFENNGTVDKFIGDCIMAYWGDLADSEDDEFVAVKTALEIKKRVDKLRETNKQENKISFDVKIGINTGEAILGLAGTDKIMSYTAMGDAVNVASRLETACSAFKKDILISDSTYQAAKDKIAVEPIGKISVKGKEEQIEVYEVLSLVEANKIDFQVPTQEVSAGRAKPGDR